MRTHISSLRLICAPRCQATLARQLLLQWKSTKEHEDDDQRWIFAAALAPHLPLPLLLLLLRLLLPLRLPYYLSSL